MKVNESQKVKAAVEMESSERETKIQRDSPMTSPIVFIDGNYRQNSSVAGVVLS
jgi:glutaredoxin